MNHAPQKILCTLAGNLHGLDSLRVHLPGLFVGARIGALLHRTAALGAQMVRNTVRDELIVLLDKNQNEEMLSQHVHLVHDASVVPKPGECLFTHLCVDAPQTLGIPRNVPWAVLAMLVMRSSVELVDRPIPDLAELFLLLQTGRQCTVPIVDNAIDVRVVLEGLKESGGRVPIVLRAPFPIRNWKETPMVSKSDTCITTLARERSHKHGHVGPFGDVRTRLWDEVSLFELFWFSVPRRSPSPKTSFTKY